VFSCVEFYKRVIDKLQRKELFLNLIPVISAVLGVVFGLIAFYVFPDIMLGDTIWFAILSGATSGLSATGCNQIFKQLKKLGVEVKEKQDE
jgi:hypothetical protein